MDDSREFRRAVDRLNAKKAALDAQRPLAENRRLTFMKADHVPFEATIISPLTFHHLHFVPGEPRSRRCGFKGCLHCRRGLPVQTRYVMAIELEDGLVKLFELSERHRGIIEELQKGKRGQVGARVRIFKKWKAPNAPIVIELLGFTTVAPMEIDRLVASMCLPAQVIVDRSKE